MTTPAKVLVVDDTPHNVKLLADLLAVKGYAVATAVSENHVVVASVLPGNRHVEGRVHPVTRVK